MVSFTWATRGLWLSSCASSVTHCKRSLKNNEPTLVSPSRWTTAPATWLNVPLLRTKWLSFCSSVFTLPKDSPLCLIPIFLPHLTYRMSANPQLIFYQGGIIQSSFAVPGRKPLAWFSFPQKPWVIFSLLWPRPLCSGWGRSLRPEKDQMLIVGLWILLLKSKDM